MWDSFPPTNVSCRDAVVNDLPPDSHPSMVDYWCDDGGGHKLRPPTNWMSVEAGAQSLPPLPGNPRQRQKQKVDFQFLFH